MWRGWKILETKSDVFFSLPVNSGFLWEKHDEICLILNEESVNEVLLCNQDESLSTLINLS